MQVRGRKRVTRYMLLTGKSLICFWEWPGSEIRSRDTQCRCLVVWGLLVGKNMRNNSEYSGKVSSQRTSRQIQVIYFSLLNSTVLAQHPGLDDLCSSGAEKKKQSLSQSSCVFPSQSCAKVKSVFKLAGVSAGCVWAVSHCSREVWCGDVLM